MSSEVVKKRGRPKKVISDPVEVEMPELTKKSTTRAKSTNATTSKPVKAKTPATSPKVAAAEKSDSKPTISSISTQKTPSKAHPPRNPTPTKEASQTPAPAPAKPPPKASVTPEASKILSKVRELSAKPVPAPEDPTKSSKPSPSTILPKSSPPTPSKATHTTPPPKLSSTSTKPPLPPTKPFAPSKTPPATPSSQPTPRIPIAALNSQIVSNISSRAGARPNTAGSTNLPPNYKPVARKITMAIVAMPIVIVTSWVLYQRLVLGEDRKLLVRPGMTMVESSRGEDAKTEPSPTH